jgi:hypothetical protein
MSKTLSYTNGESWKTYWDKIEKPEREKLQVGIMIKLKRRHRMKSLLDPEPNFLIQM